MKGRSEYHHGNLAPKILELAAKIIAENGTENLSLREIARRLGVSHSAPNRHFKNKAALMSALATRGWSEATEAGLASLDTCSSDNANDRLKAIGRGFIRWALLNPAFFRTLYHPEVNRYANESLIAALDQFKSIIRDEIQESQAQGRFQDTSLSALSLLLNAFPTGVAMFMIDPLLSEGLTKSKRQRELLVEEILNLVLPSDA
jgi:AcrR family transcriptional regulator